MQAAGAAPLVLRGGGRQSLATSTHEVSPRTATVAPLGAVHKCQTDNPVGDRPKDRRATIPKTGRFDLTIVGGTHVVAAPSWAGLAFIVSQIAQGGTWVHLQRLGAEGMGVASSSSLPLMRSTPPSETRHSPGTFSSTDYMLSPDGVPAVCLRTFRVSRRLLRRGRWCFRRKRH